MQRKSAWLVERVALTDDGRHLYESRDRDEFLTDDAFKAVHYSTESLCSMAAQLVSARARIRGMEHTEFKAEQHGFEWSY